MLLSLPGELITYPLAYKFVDPKIQKIYEISMIHEEQFKKLGIPNPDEWIPVYRRWKRFYPQQESKYVAIFELYVKDRNLISQFVLDIMSDVINKVDSEYSTDALLIEHNKIISDQMELLKEDLV